MKEAHSTPQFIYSMVPASTGAPIDSLKPPETLQKQKQEKFTQECYIKTRSETYLDQLIIP